MKNNRIFVYVDSENVNVESWIDAFTILDDDCTIYYFWTTKSYLPIEPTTLEHIKSYSCSLKSVKIESATKNALDFVLVAALSANAKQFKNSSHIIISNDHGYDAIKQIVPNVIRSNNFMEAYNTATLNIF